jgi:hypothetical protein
MTKGTAIKWTAEEDAMLAQLIVTSRVSFGVAAREMSIKFPNSAVKFTRNACISRAHRLQLEGRTAYENNRSPSERSPYKQRNTPREPSLSIFWLPRPRPNPKPFPKTHKTEIVDGTCQFIDNNDKKCRKPYDGQTNWCEEHRKLCYEVRHANANPRPMPGLRRW